MLNSPSIASIAGTVQFQTHATYFVYIVLRIPGPEMAEKKECKSPEYFREVFQVGAASIQVLIKQELLQMVYILSGLMRTL